MDYRQRIIEKTYRAQQVCSGRKKKSNLFSPKKIMTIT